MASLSPFLAAVLLFTAADFEKLGWLSGCHSFSTPRSTIEENWTSTQGGLMLGVNRTLRQGKAIAFEFLRIDSELTYIAMPNGKSETRFRLTSQTDTEVVFQNPEHDFPKRITYRKTADGILARVDGGEGSPKAQEFAFKTVPCAGK